MSNLARAEMRVRALVIAHILGILLMNSYDTEIYILATTAICSLSTLNWSWIDHSFSTVFGETYELNLPFGMSSKLSHGRCWVKSPACARKSLHSTETPPFGPSVDVHYRAWIRFQQTRKMIACATLHSLINCTVNLTGSMVNLDSSAPWAPYLCEFFFFVSAL